MGRKKTSDALAIIGAIPPPYGGVTVHIKRFISLLRSKNIKTKLYDLMSKSNNDQDIISLGKSPFRFFKLLLLFKEKAIHVHTNNLLALSVIGQVAKIRSNKNFVITIHSERPVRKYRNGSWLKRKLLRDCFRSAFHVICVSDTIAKFLREDLSLKPSCCSVVPAYLAPDLEETNEKNIPVSLQQFIEGKAMVVGTHGWFGYFLNGQHVYGFEEIADLVKKINESKHNIVVYTLISGCYDRDHRKKILALRDRYPETWMISETPFPAAALYKKTSLFIRPTITDGDSVSIRECLALKTPVLASDSVKRPAGCLTYQNGNRDEFQAQFWRLAAEGVPISPEKDSLSPTATQEDRLVEIISEAIDL